MGQRASRALAGRLEKGMQKYRHEMDKDIQRNIQEKQRQATHAGFTDPNAMEAGFTRGMSPPIRQDLEQEAFLKSQHGSEQQELPEDLLKFLKTMGPVERKERKGPRLRRHQLEEQERLKQQLDEGRQVRDMPIMEDVDKFTTTRTTNFSRRQAEEDKVVGVTGREMYRLLLDSDQEVTVESLVKRSSADHDEKKVYSDLLQNTLKYMQIPVIMKDTDDTYVGVWPDKVNEMEKMKLKTVPESEVRILLSVEDPDEQKKHPSEPRLSKTTES